jgi:hypothetical protein
VTAAEDVRSAVPPATGDSAVLVIGMHRGGTSATAGLLAQLGLGVPAPDDLLASSRATNQRGHWESRSLLRFNIRLMRHLGGTWSTPPRLEPGWELDPSLDGWRREAAGVFDATLDRRPSVWKDPRNCILLPFWRTVLDPPVAAVLILRDPLEVAASLQARDAMPTTVALAVWERHLRDASTNLVGIPTLAGDYETVVGDPGRWCVEVVDFLEHHGVRVHPAASAVAADFVDGGLHHQRSSPERAGASMASTAEVWRALRACTGEHATWHGPDLGPEPRWVDDVLTLARQAEEARLEQVALHDSRAYRFARSVTRWRERLRR